MVLTGSADKESIAFDLERGQEAFKLSSVHEASIKTVTQLETNSNVVITGGREGKIAVHDLRMATQGSSEQNSTVTAWRNTSTQQVLTKNVNS